MKIAVPLARTSISGGTRIALQYAGELARLGHQVTLVFPSDTQFDYFSLPMNIKIRSVIVPPFARSVIGSLADAFAISRVLEHSDLILCNSWQMVYVAMGSIAFRRGTRIVHLIQHLDSVIISEKPRFYQWRNQILYRFIYQLPFTTKIVVSQWLKEALATKFKQTSVCVPNGIDIFGFTSGRPPKWEPPSDTCDILCTGRLAKWKGYADVLEAVRILAASNKRVRLIVASRESITIPNNIPGILVKPSSDRELGYLYQHCSVFVMASWCEGFGLPALEAMACGAPVVTTACCGTDDFVRSGENCLVVPPRQPMKLAQAIKTVLQDPELALRLSHAGIETGRYFTTKRMAWGFMAAIDTEYRIESPEEYS